MICITYIMLIFFGVSIALNKSKKINNILIYLGIFVIAPLGILPINNIIQVTFLDYNLDIIKQDQTSFYLIFAFILTFIGGVLHNIMLKPVNYKEIGFIFILTSCAIFGASTNNLIISTIIIQIISLLYAIIIGISKSHHKKSSFLKLISINFLGILFLLIGIDFYTNITGKTIIENIVSYQHFSKYLILIGLAILSGFPLLINNLAEVTNCTKPKVSVFLVIFLSNIVLVMLIKMFSGEPFLFYIGFIFTLYGIIFSLLTSDLRKILTYSIIHNTGFIMMFISLTSVINWYVINSFLFTYILCMLSLFIIVSFCEYYFHKNNLLELQGAFYGKPIIGIALLFIAFNSLGLPCSSIFILKNIILNTLSSSGNYVVYIVMFFSVAAYALHIGFRILFFLYLSKPASQNYVNTYKNYNISKTITYTLLIIVVINIIQLIILYLNEPNYLNNILNGLKTGFFGVFLFILTYKFSNSNKELIIYKLSNITIKYAYHFLLNIVTILSKAYVMFINKNRIFIMEILTSSSKVSNLYYNSRIIVVILLFIIFLGLTLTILKIT